MHDGVKKEIAKQMVINTNRRNNCTIKLSLSSILYLSKRMILLYYHSLTLPTLFFILLYAIHGYTLASFYNFTPHKYRDCQLDNMTVECNQLFNTMTSFKNVQYEITISLHFGTFYANWFLANSYYVHPSKCFPMGISKWLVVSI